MRFQRVTMAACILILLAGTCLAGEVVVVYSDGRPSEALDIIERDGKAYLAVTQVARLVGLEKTVGPKGDKVTLGFEGREVEVVVGGTVWLAGGKPVQAVDPAYAEGGDVLVSLASVEGVLAETFGKSLRWDEARRQIIVGLPAPNIIDIQVRAEPEQVIATVKTIGVLSYDLLPVVDNRIELLVRGGVFSKRLGFEAEGGLVERITAKQEAEGARIEVTLGSTGPSYRVFPQWNPDGIVIKVWMRAITEIPEPTLKPPRKIAWKERFAEDQAKLDLVVVDPGHGGLNRGSVGATGYLEKDFNLALARKIRASLEARGLEVIMTRNDDISVSLETRTEVANSVGADLFLSIHANGFTSPEARGFEVYFLSAAANGEARFNTASESGALEPASIISDPGDEVAFILWDTAQNEFVAESSYLAQLVNEEIAKAADLPNRGVKQADFFVLKGAYLPGILVETAFITNPQEEAMLKDEAFQGRVVAAVVSAIARFKEDYNR